MQNSWLIYIFLGYISGSIPFGLLIGLTHGIDIRKSGSGNVGATNTGRILGKKWGIFCLLLDVLKGLIPVLVAGYAMGYISQSQLTTTQAFQWLAVAAAAVLGHVFPVWLKFKGGKGVATGLGVLLGFWPTLTIPGIGAIFTWIAVVLIFRFVSLASITAACAIPAYLYLHSTFCPMNDVQTGTIWPFYALTGFMAALVVFRHRANVVRILSGTEPKISKNNQPNEQSSPTADENNDS